MQSESSNKLKMPFFGNYVLNILINFILFGKIDLLYYEILIRIPFDM
ncbi:hypothetical protein SAMN05443292_1796 [Halpernia frigidisoli]|uniref:Uncharacterized protein n=1 Tax=Halpernia frigidisoli TaxID=1125876 RepID=A0A1I3GDW4_9FLAO|nr:hypothetical protein SAMN05443292_1796 [Halpernia frigidisoli]